MAMTDASNKRSIRGVQGLGFTLEGTIRYQRVIRWGKEGNGVSVPAERAGAGQPARDTTILGLCWDDWEDGARERLDEVMNRPVGNQI